MAITLAKTKAGMVSGVEIPGKDITVFKGVPFAAPPVGELRWKEPQPVQPWEGVRKADSFTPAAWQAMHREGSFYDVEWGNEPFDVSEDCLYLNIWTPAKSEDEKLPVAVWIYGGGFMSGFAHEREFDGEAFAGKDVVYVSINYRLHVFGYLAHAGLDEEAGRYMLKAGNSSTGIFIYPGYEFKLVDSLITNFHLPKSTLLMLISALYDREEILKAYDVAVEEKYRFFSYGDAMLIL